MIGIFGGGRRRLTGMRPRRKIGAVPGGVRATAGENGGKADVSMLFGTGCKNSW
jgi:hypothetical protein